MKRILTIVAVVGMAVVGAADVACAQVHGWENLGRSNGNLRPDSYTAGRAVQGSQSGGTRGNHPGMVNRQPSGRGHVVQRSHGSHGSAHNYGYGYRPSYTPYYRPYYRYPTYYYPRPYYYVAPIVIPPGRFFGPGAARGAVGFW